MFIKPLVASVRIPLSQFGSGMKTRIFGCSKDTHIAAAHLETKL